MAALKRRARKTWHVMRRRFSADSPPIHRIVVTPTKWLNDASSPVMLMVDDLTNAWHSHRGAGAWEPGGDWGGGFRRQGSALRFLESELMESFPEARVTFFTVAGPISPYTWHQPFSYSGPLDASDEASGFFRSLSVDPRYELAYHGLNHGTPGNTTAEFVQEWRGFRSLDAAVAQTRQGLEIFARATGTRPRGGKYGGYDYNSFADDAVGVSGFEWWCRDWMPRDTRGRVPDEYYEPQLFADAQVVALPSTVHGHFWYRAQIDRLLSRRQIISVAEHIAPVRPDGLIQAPNIVDDMAELRRLYRHLRGRNVWHATGSQIADYVVARDRTTVFDVSSDGFSLRYNGRVPRPRLTLRIEAAAICGRERPLISIECPSGEAVSPPDIRYDPEHYSHLATLTVVSGRYRVTSRS